VNNTKKIALAVAILCSAGTTLAQEINPSWYVQPSVVGMKPDTDFGVDKNAWGGGLKFGKPVHQYLDLQFGATHARVKDGSARYSQTLLGIDTLVMLSRKNFRPFGLIGVGFERDKVDNVMRNVNRTSPYYTLGVGFQLGLTPQWSMQADLRSVRGKLRSVDQFGFTNSANKYLTVGFNYAFNPPPAAVVAMAPEPMAAPMAEAAPAPVAAPARFEKVTLSGTQLFAFDSAELTMPQPKLEDVAAALQADTTVNGIDITGHADRIGSDAYNQRLSERRAMAVRDYLVSKGVAADRLKAIGKGETQPVVQCTEKNRSSLIKCLEPNRRVEVEQITIERRVQ
jgi:OOP family OmpA-OmpF porin